MESENAKKIEVETLASDLASVVAENQSGIVKKIIEEQEKKEDETYKRSPERKKNMFFLTIGGILIGLSFLFVFLVFLFKEKILITEVKPEYRSIIFTDQTNAKEINGLKKEAIIQAILDEVNATKIKEGGVFSIYLKEKEKIIGLRRFFELIEANLDQNNIFFVNDNFLLGAVNSQNKKVFILINMRSMADVFSVMREWENKMFLDLHQFFEIDLNLETKYLLEKGFEDGIVQNKNARILRGNDGSIILMYVFAEDDSLIITNDEETVKELILRLVSSKVKK